MMDVVGLAVGLYVGDVVGDTVGEVVGLVVGRLFKILDGVMNFQRITTEKKTRTIFQRQARGDRTSSELVGIAYPDPKTPNHHIQSPYPSRWACVASWRKTRF